MEATVFNETNCKNCGAAKDPLLIECPYCGTPYYTTQFLDLTSPGIIDVKIDTGIGTGHLKCRMCYGDIAIHGSHKDDLQVNLELFTVPFFDSHLKKEVPYEYVVEEGSF